MKDQWSIRIVGIVLLILGFAINYWIARKKFKRRNFAGLERFHSFETAWLTRLIEGLGRFISIAFILGGITSILLSLW